MHELACWVEGFCTQAAVSLSHKILHFCGMLS